MLNNTRHSKIIDIDGLAQLHDRLPNQRIVQCHGVFDVLHAGHVAYFESAKKFGDVLVVTITADQHVNKGPGRPHFNSSVRANMIAALSVVDYVCVSQFPTAVETITALKPNFYVKGPDYKNREADPTGAIYTEEATVKAADGEIVFTDDDTFSSSTLINRFFSAWTEDQQKVINQIKADYSFETIEKQLAKLSTLDVVIAGEPIVDTYVFCQPEAISSKSPSVSAKFQYEENYAGGSLAIANHLADFARSVTLLITHGKEDYFKKLLAERLDPRVKLHAIALKGVPTPRKTRFIENSRAQRIFELTDVPSNQWSDQSPKKFVELLRANTSKDRPLIVADFGHGLFEGEVLQEISKLDCFIALNSQTNSSNQGFNPYTKHKNFSYLSIDTKEARLAYHDRHSIPVDLVRRIRKDRQNHGASVSMTLGANGAYFFPPATEAEYLAPAFADSVIDATGAGDAFFALTSLLVYTDCPPLLIPFIGNVFAGLKTKIIGNKSAVSKPQLIKAITSILK